jgi:hypothetical protein
MLGKTVIRKKTVFFGENVGRRFEFSDFAITG